VLPGLTCLLVLLAAGPLRRLLLLLGSRLYSFVCSNRKGPHLADLDFLLLLIYFNLRDDRAPSGLVFGWDVFPFGVPVLISLDYSLKPLALTSWGGTTKKRLAFVFVT
jgi:hypothetical protein